ncbi:MAG: RimK/LysX family protein [Candidatus Saccharimonadales bacterium]
MTKAAKPKTVIGRVEKIALPELALTELHARIDTGAQTSAVWASHVEVVNDCLEVVFLGKEHPNYTGKKYYFDEFTHGMVASSNGQAELRYKVKVLVHIGGKKVRVTFTLANRATQVYPVLVGRNILRGKFLVDIKLGDPLTKLERERSRKLQQTNPKGDSK